MVAIVVPFCGYPNTTIYIYTQYKYNIYIYIHIYTYPKEGTAMETTGEAPRRALGNKVDCRAGRPR